MNLCGTQCILGQKVSPKSWMAAISLSPLWEYCYNLVLSCNIRVKGDKIKREYNPVRLPLETWYSLTVPQCATSSKGNWNSCSLYCACTFQGNAWDLEKIFLHQILQFLVWKRISWQLFFLDSYSVVLGIRVRQSIRSWNRWCTELLRFIIRVWLVLFAVYGEKHSAYSTFKPIQTP